VAAVSLVAAFLGGVLVLLAPCSALLLPAFFAYGFSNRTALVRATLVFFVGLCIVLLPLGLAASLAARVLIQNRQTSIVLAGSVLIALGALLVMGRGFSLVPARLLPVGRGTATLMTGVVYGMTGFCSGPLLGGVLTVAVAGANPLFGGVLLLVYGLGMVAPLFVLAALWDRYHLGRRRWLRGSTRWTNLVGGTLFLALGVAFIASQGGLLLSGSYDDLGLSDLGFRLQSWLADLTCSPAAPCA
jgi:cytochrome c biogenesis protein CcdA